MQVQRVQNTQPQLQFGMLKTKNIPAEKLSSTALDLLENVENAVANTGDVTLLVEGEFLSPKIITGTAVNYSAPFEVLEINPMHPEFLHIKTMEHPLNDTEWKFGKNHEAVYKFPTAEDAQAAYEEMKSARTTLAKAALFTKIIYNSLVRRFEQASTTAQQEITNRMRAEKFLKRTSM